MATLDEAFQQQLLATFRAEAAERLDVLSSGLIELEQAETADTRSAILESLVREAHSLKGASRAVNLMPVEAAARAMEKVLAALKQEALAATPDLFDVLHRAVDGIKGFLAAPAAGEEEMAVLRQLEQALEQPFSTLAPQMELPPLPRSAEISQTPDTVRISTIRLGALLLMAEQLLSSKLAAEQQVAELRAVRHTLAEWKKEMARLTSRQARLEAEKQNLRRLDATIERLEKTAEQDFRHLGGAVSNLLEGMKSVLMLPITTLIGIFPKMVRDLSRDRGKEVEWIVNGSDIEIDKRILDEMKDPFIHLVRNSIDHGIEPPDEREEKGKPRRGRITFGIEQKTPDKIEISVSDDGAGMDAAGIRAAALKHGIVTPASASALNEEEVLALALRSGVTTSPIVTDISGRGLGLAIVQEKVTRLNGSLSFDSRPGAGTTFRMTLPLTLATFRGVVIQSGEHLFIAPTANVEKVLRIDRKGIRTVENRATLQLQHQAVSLMNLAEVLGLQAGPPAKEPEKLPIIVLSAGGKPIAFGVDAIHNEQEVLVKPLGKQLVRVRNIGGASILGSGRVVPILNVPDLLISAMEAAAGAAPLSATKVKEETVRSLLVVEDSITTRTLLKSILEAAGFRVVTAVDGVDALTRLHEGTFDLVVSDVAMPRMNGFDLTARIRSDTHLGETPVVLVTSLESREDRERGIDVGANAYIVKSSFDQSNLLETIRRLI
jgi:two-component system chemotaxis sensor kinase CheA